MKRYPFHQAEKIMWIGAMSLFVLAIVVGLIWGTIAQLPVTCLLFFWGFIVRRYFTQG